MMKQHITVRITLLAFIFNIFLPFFAVHTITQAQAADNPTELSSLFGDKILVCTADGFKWMTWEELQKEGYPHHPDKPPYECAFCYIAAHVHKDFLKTSQHFIAFTEKSVTDAAFIYADDRLFSKGLPVFYLNRGPPMHA